MRGVAAGQQLARQQQALARLPSRDLFFGEAVEGHAARAGIGAPMNLGPELQIRRFQQRRPCAIQREMNMSSGGAIGNHRHR